MEMHKRNIIVKCVTVEVIPELMPQFLSATIKNGHHTRQESGNLRFDILQSSHKQNTVFLYEAYASEEAIKEHKATVHYIEWCNQAEPCMSKPRQTLSHTIIMSKDFENALEADNG